MTVTWGLVLEYEFADPKASVAGFGLMAFRTGPDFQGVRSWEGLCAQHLCAAAADPTMGQTWLAVSLWDVLWEHSQFARSLGPLLCCDGRMGSL